jgi:hypothetical protein
MFASNAYSDATQRIRKKVKKVNRYYGIDFGMRNIVISRIDIDQNPFENQIPELEYLTDSIGKRNIFNGMQYVQKPSLNDAMSRYKKRRLGNECQRSKEIISVSNGDDESYKVINKLQLDDREVEINRDVSEAAIVSHIRELIDTDMKNSDVELQNVKVIFAITTSLSPKRRFYLRERITSMFNLEEDTKLDVEFIADDYAMTFAKFDLTHPQFANRTIEIESPNEEVTLIINASHSQTSLIIVKTEHDKSRESYHLDIVDRYPCPVSGHSIDEIIANEIVEQAVRAYGESSRDELDTDAIMISRDVEKIKHDLSMYASVRHTMELLGADLDIQISRKDIRRSIAHDRFVTVRRLATALSKYPISSIELAGGFSRSFVIQDILDECMRDRTENKGDIPVRRSLSADETTAKGAALYGLITEYATNNRMEFEFSRIFKVMHTFPKKKPAKADNGTVEVLSPWGTEEVPINYYEQSIEFKGGPTRYRMNDTIRMMEARNSSTSSSNIQDSNLKMLAIKASRHPNLIKYGDLKYELMVDANNLDDRRKDGFAADLYMKLDMLDLPEVVTVAGRLTTYSEYDYDVFYDDDIVHLQTQVVEDAALEAELRYYKDICDRIGKLYNQMEAFYFDRNAYTSKKDSIQSEIARIKRSYAYPTSSIDKLENDYKKLLDTYEFCRIVTIDADMLTEPNHARDSEVGTDSRLSRDMIDSLIQEEEGLVMMEDMMSAI